MTRVFLDANVLFSAAWRERNGLVLLWRAESLSLVTSAYAAEEAGRNLERQRPEAMARLDSLLRDVELISSFHPLAETHGLPSKDTPILAAAVASRCRILLTGDIGDFGHLIGSTAQGVRILTPAMFLAELGGL